MPLYAASLWDSFTTRRFKTPFRRPWGTRVELCRAESSIELYIVPSSTLHKLHSYFPPESSRPSCTRTVPKYLSLLNNNSSNHSVSRTWCARVEEMLIRFGTSRPFRRRGERKCLSSNL
ncbi:hypothetical protein PUN28_001465 [Cardiocondyla obscurior]|uniref:Uncharacterized protein n=1 Tax=Cardiocondyla obscurior TaxID=286306 RepID=A0AAW2H5M1_9HYME